MRISILPLIAGLVFAAAAAVASSDAAEVESLEASAGAGACGGSIGCSNPQDIKISPANNASTAYAHDASTLADGSYADAQTTATFGVLHVYADAYRAIGSDAQSHAGAKTIDYIPAANIQGVVNQSFFISGSLAPAARTSATFPRPIFRRSATTRPRANCSTTPPGKAPRRSPRRWSTSPTPSRPVTRSRASSIFPPSPSRAMASSTMSITPIRCAST